MELIIGWGVIWGLVCGIVAANRGRSGIGWFFLGFFFSFIAVIVLALIPARNAPPQVIVQLQGLPDTAQSSDRPLEISKAGDPPPSNTTGIWSILLLIFMLALGAYLSSKDTKPSSAAVAPTAALESTPAKAVMRSCENVWSLCADNEDWANHNSDKIEARSACQRAVSDQARYGEPKWPAWPMPSFGMFYGGSDYIKTGIAVLIEDDVKIQNAFGTHEKMRAICRYSLITGKVQSVSIGSK